MRQSRYALSILLWAMLVPQLILLPLVQSEGGDAEVTRFRNLRPIRLEPNDADVTRFRNLQTPIVESNHADITRFRNVQFFELAPPIGPERAGILFEDDFEEYDMGSFPSIGEWELWSSGANQNIVTDSTFSSPTKSLQLLGTTENPACASIYFSTDDTVIGYEVFVKVKEVDQTSETSVIMGFSKRLSEESWSLGATVAFNDDGTIRDEKGNEIATFEADKWYNVLVVLNNIDDVYAIWVDNELLGTSFAAQDLEFEAFSLIAERSCVTTYFDDVKIFEEGVYMTLLLVKESYKLYNRYFDQDWWFGFGEDMVSTLAPNFDPMKWTAKQLLKEILPRAVGSLAVFEDAFQIAMGISGLLGAFYCRSVHNTLQQANLLALGHHDIRDDFSNLISRIDLALAAVIAENTNAFYSSLLELKSEVENLYEVSVGTYEGLIYSYLRSPASGAYEPYSSFRPSVYRFLVKYPQHEKYLSCLTGSNRFLASVEEGLLVALRRTLEADYLHITDLLGSRKELQEQVQASLAPRPAAPLVLEAYWTVDGEEVTEVEVGEEVVANVILTTYDLMKVNGEVTVEVWKDVRPWCDSKHDNYETTEPIDLDVGEQSDVIELSFIAEHASNRIPGLGFKGYYLKVHFTGSGISNVGTNRIEDVWVTWIDGEGDCMKNQYPPRLKVNMKSGILDIVAESPVNLLIIDPQERRIGFDYISQGVVNEIMGALYSGPSTEPQVVSISEPLDGDYTVLLVGTGTAPYSLTARLILPETTASQTFNGETVEGAVYVYNVDITDEVVTANPNPTFELDCFKQFIGGLPDDSFDQSIRLADHLKKALFSKIDEIILKVEAGNYTDAVNKLLQDIRAKMDGDPTPDDWIICRTTELCVIIDHIISSIETLQPG